MMNATRTDDMTAAELAALLNGLADTRNLALDAGATAVATANNDQWLRLAGAGLQRFGATWAATLRV